LTFQPLEAAASVRGRKSGISFRESRLLETEIEGHAMRRIMFSLSAVILLSAAQTAFAQDMPAACSSGGHMGHEMPAMTDMSGMSDMQKALAKGMDKMNAAMMSAMMIEDPDVAFVCSMIPHHQGAIDMAKVVLQYGKDPWVKEMARKVIDAQTQEIADMKKWLGEHAK
jgi:uncharacterized protein (DUF305 family)